MADKLTIYTHYYEEAKKLLKEIKDFAEFNEYFNTSAMKNFMDRYNSLLKKYHTSSGIPLEFMKIYDYELSQSKKTVNINCINRTKVTIESTMGLLQDMITSERNKNKDEIIPIHQMRKCFKTGVDGCPKKPELDKNKVFVGMPFNDDFYNDFEFGVKLAVEFCGKKLFRADEKIDNKDIMCKICEEIQKSKYLIFNISEHNPNVMLELGLSYGLGKETIIIKNKKTKNITDLSNTEYIEYSHAVDLKNKLVKYFEEH